LPGDFIAERPVNSFIQPAGLPIATPLLELLRRPRESAQYTSIDYTQTLGDHGVLASVGSVGDAYDNAMAESFVDSFKTELIADRVWRTRAQLELAIVEYVGWYNDARLHESLGDIPPAEFETLSSSSTVHLSLSSIEGTR
jgi:putative transposase